MLFFHVGLHKTGTTFLQKAVFPRWKDISYIEWPHLELFLRLDEGRTYLVSREGLSGQNWAHHDARDRSLRVLADMFPDSRTLVSFRKHSGYILSSYRQYVQRGGAVEFDEYFDPEGDRGLMKRDDFVFRSKIESIERHFGHRPFVFLHDELKNMSSLLKDLEQYIGGRAPSPSEIPNRRYNEGLGYYPAKLLRRINTVTKSELNPEGKYNLNHPNLRRLRLTPAFVCQEWLSFLPSRPFLPPETIKDIDALYAADWHFVRAYAQDRRSLAGSHCR